MYENNNNVILTSKKADNKNMTYYQKKPAPMKPPATEYDILASAAGTPTGTTLGGYIIYASGSNYIAKNLLTGNILYNGSSFVAAAQACSDDITPVSPVSSNYITVAKPSSAIVIDGMIDFSGKGIYFDGGMAEYDFHSYNGICFSFDGAATGLSGYIHGGIKNCYLYGNIANTSSVFVAANNIRMTISGLNAARDGTPGAYSSRKCYRCIDLENDCYITTVEHCNFHAFLAIHVGTACNGTWISHNDFGYEAQDYAITVEGGTPVGIVDNYFENVNTAIYVTGGSLVTIRNNYINANNYGIVINAGSLVKIQGNQIYTPSGSTAFTGIRLYGSIGSCSILDNTIWALMDQTNYIGIKIEGVSHLTITGNHIALNHTGCSAITQTGTSTYIVINSNVFDGAGGLTGITANSITYSAIVGNAFNAWGTDYTIGTSTGCEIVHNTT